MKMLVLLLVPFLLLTACSSKLLYVNTCSTCGNTTYDHNSTSGNTSYYYYYNITNNITSGGGNPFDQELNTTSSVQFANINLTNTTIEAAPSILFSNYYGGSITTPDEIHSSVPSEFYQSSLRMKSGDIYFTGIGDALGGQMRISNVLAINYTPEDEMIYLGFDGDMLIQGGDVRTYREILNENTTLRGQTLVFSAGDAIQDAGNYDDAEGAVIEIFSGQYSSGEGEWVGGGIVLQPGHGENSSGNISLNGPVFAYYPVTIENDLNVSGTIYYGALQANSPIRSTNFFYTDFMAAGAYQTNFGAAAISSGTSNDVVAAAGKENHPGTVDIRDSTTANGGYRYWSAMNQIVLNNGTGGFVTFLPGVASTVNWTVIMGFHDATAGTALPVDGCFLIMQNNNTRWQARCRNNNAETKSTTNVTLPISTNYYRAQINVINTTLVQFQMFNSTATNFDQIWEENITTNIPSTAARATGFGIIGTQSTTGAAQVLLTLDEAGWYYNTTVIRR